eukprot:12407651-Karenia_brevis.AAC.1
MNGHEAAPRGEREDVQAGVDARNVELNEQSTSEDDEVAETKELQAMKSKREHGKRKEMHRPRRHGRRKQ